MNEPVISVVIPTWNAADYLPATLDSIFAQSYDRFEIIVVDDGSTDGTADLISGYGERIRCISQENWGGPSRPRNAAIEAARGELICFFDADDLMDPDKLALAVDVFARLPEVDFVFTGFREIDEAGATLNDDFLAEYKDFRAHLESTDHRDAHLLAGRTAYSLLLRANFIGTSSVVCRRDLFDRVGPFDEEMLNSDDIDMWRRIAYSGATFAFIDRVLHSYRKVAGGVTGRGAARRLPSVLRGLRKQLDLELTAEERAGVQRRIHAIELDYAYGLCNSKRFEESLKVYRGALGERVTATAVKGLIRALVRSRLG